MFCVLRECHVGYELKPKGGVEDVCKHLWPRGHHLQTCTSGGREVKREKEKGGNVNKRGDASMRAHKQAKLNLFKARKS